MATALLMTKLGIPLRRPNLIVRDRLIQRLKEGLRLGRRLTLVSAPAGFGKTTLISGWLADQERSSAWVSLDAGDNDPIQLFRYMLAALQQIEPGIGQLLDGALDSTSLPSLQSLLTPLVNDLAASGRPLVLVLDDYHLVTSPVVHEALQYLVASLPPQVHLALCTREDPPLPLAQLRAREQVTEVREKDLRFSVEEAAAFLRETMGLDLPSELTATLQARTEGWITGLQLAALALQEDQADPVDFVATFAGDDRYVLDYLVDEVLARQSPAIREFLRKTSVLDQLCGSLCDALTGRADGQETLEYLHRANLFVTPLDRRRDWYRYHHLFAEVLRTAQRREEAGELHRRAAEWHQANGRTAQAIDHSLDAGRALGDWAPAGVLIGAAAGDAILTGRIATVRSWLEALPDEHVRSEGELSLWLGWTLAFTGDLAGARSYADAAEKWLSGADPTADALAKLHLLRAVIGIGQRDYDAAACSATRGLTLLAEDDLRWRLIALWSRAVARERTSHVQLAIDSLREADQVGRELGGQIFSVVVEAELVRNLEYSGRRREALVVGEEALARHADGSGRASPVVAYLLGYLAGLHYQANALDLARCLAERGLALTEQLPLDGAISRCLGALGPILYAQGETEAAFSALRRAREAADREALHDPSWLLAWEANLSLRSGNLAQAVSWAEGASLSLDTTHQYLHLEEHLAFARLLIAQNRLADARLWLDRLGGFLHERGLNRWLMLARILQALAAERLGERSIARDLLAEALELAAPEGYRRAFLDEDPLVLGPLADVRDAAPTFVGEILDYAGVPSHSRREPTTQSQALVDPLSERELEVLGLIAEGFSNEQIAQRLFIAHSTVKRHINNLYDKLAVGSRTRAVAKARSLRLL